MRSAGVRIKEQAMIWSEANRGLDMPSEAIVLAGGLGTRLKGVVKDIPKPMAEVNGRPFLSYILDYLARAGVGRAVLSIGYRYGSIKDFFGPAYKDMELDYAIEDEPLGTGGAILEAMKAVRGQEIFILNGDTFFDLSLQGLIKAHRDSLADITLALKPMRDLDRYGTVILKGDRVAGFREKSFQSSGYINGGVYAVKKNIAERLKALGLKRFSFESDFLQREIAGLNAFGFVSDSYFIDIGIPEDYERARSDFKNFKKGAAG